MMIKSQRASGSHGRSKFGNSYPIHFTHPQAMYKQSLPCNPESGGEYFSWRVAWKGWHYSTDITPELH